MANRKTEKLKINEEETPFEETLLENLPLGFRFMVKKETEFIGELYRRVKFSKSRLHQSNQYSNYPTYKPLSNLLIDDRTMSETESYE